ncbi:MAG: helix-hairpin-helix domain-containing protein [Bacteroidales bacterium]|nr:helix-hairpin-helix domain-containing protein [Bacteroidales bacterium]
MKSNKTKTNRGLIVMNKGERIAVISLLIIIAILMAFSVFRPALRFSNKDMQAFHNLDSLIATELASPGGDANIKETEIGSTSKTSSKSYSGSSSKTSSMTYSGSSSKTSPSSSSGFSSGSSPSKNTSAVPNTKKIPILELNSTDSVALVDLPQIGEVMASRIQRYRDRLGGFVCYEQLYEVKGMDSARFATVRPYLLLDTTHIRKLEVNRDEFKTLLRHPYLEYEQVKAIVNHRERKGLIRNWEQLKGIVGEVNPLLEKYVSY